MIKEYIGGLIILNGFNRKQKRAFNSIYTGLKLASRCNDDIRFLTLTTSDIQKESVLYDIRSLNDDFRRFKQIIRRTTILKLLLLGHLDHNKIRYYYPNKKLNDRLKFDYVKIRTNEGNGVLHILYKGDYIPYNYIVEIWNDIHNSWDINIKKVGSTKKSLLSTASYVISQYLSGQNSSFQRFSQSWLWTVRGYYKRYAEFIVDCKRLYFYNPVQNKYYKNKIEINIYDKWMDLLYKMTHPPPRFKQTQLAVV